MITSSTASFAAYSDTGASADVTRALGIDPDEHHERGDRHGRDGELVRAQSAWELRVRAADVPEDDESGFGSVRTLLATLLPLADRLDALRGDWEFVVWWGGFSDSEQGGFVIEPDVLAGLARLGAPLYGTAYLDDPAED
jgi:hypothetical protein